MKVFFNSRSAMRAVKFGEALDNGPDSQPGKRWCRLVAAVSKPKRISSVTCTNPITLKKKAVAVMYKPSRKAAMENAQRV